MADVGRVGLYVAVPVVDAEVSVNEAIALAAAQVCGGAHNCLRGQLERVAELQRLVRRPGRQREFIVEQLRRPPLGSQRGAAEWVRNEALGSAPVRHVQRRVEPSRAGLVSEIVGQTLQENQTALGVPNSTSQRADEEGAGAVPGGAAPAGTGMTVR